MNLPLEGGEYAAHFMLADVETTTTLAADELQLCPSEFGPIAIFPMNATRRRIVATIEQPEGEAPSLKLVQRILAQRAPEEIEAHALHWSSYFRIHHRHAAKLQVGRIFIAGDAAHIHSPFGGQGMNTGLHDVWNLVWKLDLFLCGHGNERLIDSYSSERLPVIKNVIETTDLLTKVMGTPNKFCPEGIRSRFLLMIDGRQEPSVTDDASDLSKSFNNVLELRTSDRQGVTLVRPDGYIAYSARNGGRVAAMQRMRTARKSSRVPLTARRLSRSQAAKCSAKADANTSSTEMF